MSAEHTQPQSNEEQRLARQLSLKRSHPPAELPGYEMTKFIGSGAYGEVWAGVDRNTGRRVAIKFYSHRGGLDWALLSREVEKLVFLSADRYVVQLLDVGWDSDPPYYVMEYVENGSLDARLRRQGPLPLNDAVEMFREMAVGLMHAHGKGVLHCDLKPANILLDQDDKPRLADFGQSRMTSEQMPALGTLFYMAPEQADLEAVPDARWDVYALGAILHCMLTGNPPYRSQEVVTEVESTLDLGERLTCYRQLICTAPPPAEHRQVPGMDRPLIEIIDRCLAANPEKRFSSVEAVLEALQVRNEARARKPLLMLGIVGPALLLLVATLFGGWSYNAALVETEDAVTVQALESNRFAAKYVAATVSSEIDRYFRAVEAVADDPQFMELVESVLDNAAVALQIETLSDPDHDATELDAVRAEFRAQGVLMPLQDQLSQIIDDSVQPEAASWFVSSPQGTHIAAVFDSGVQASPIGKNYAWRTYFHGGPYDLPREVRPPLHIEHTHLSAVFQSTATYTWKVAISTPMYRGDRFLGILAMTVEMGSFMKFESTDAQFAVLVDSREGENRGVILQHPLFDRVLTQHDKLPVKFSEYHVPLDDWNGDAIVCYADPLAAVDPEGLPYEGEWLAARAPVMLQQSPANGNGSMVETPTGLLVVVQEDRGNTIKPVHDLGMRLLSQAAIALVVVIVVISGLWATVFRGLRNPRGIRSLEQEPMMSPISADTLPTEPVR